MRKDDRPEPSPDEALGTLQRLAELFLAPAPATREATAPPAQPGEAPPESLPEPPSGILVLDDRGRILHLDAGAERVFRCRSAEVAGMPASMILVGDLSDEGAAMVHRQARRRDGSTFAAHITAARFASMQQTLTIVTVRDEDTFLRVVAEHRQSELRFRNLVEQIPAVTFTASLQGGLGEVYVSPQIESLLGYTQEEWLSNPVLWYERLHPDDRSKLDTEFARGCMTGGPFRAECRFVARNGQVVWVHGEARLIGDASGRPSFLQGVAFNVTDIRRLHEEQAARAVAEAEHRKEQLLSDISMALAKELPRDVPFQAVSDLLVPDHGDWCLIDVFDDNDVRRRAAVSRSFRTDGRLVPTLRARTPAWRLSDHPWRDRHMAQSIVVTAAPSRSDGSAPLDPECARLLRELGADSLLAVPLRAGDRILGVLTLAALRPEMRYGVDEAHFALQLADRIATFVDNRRLYHQLERAVHFSEMFLGVLGHDLRNPLSGIVTATSLLLRRAEGEPLTRPLNRILGSADRMRRMIDQILDFTRIRLGRGLPLERRMIDLGVIVRAVVEELEGEIAAHDVELSIEGDARGSWDADRLSQLVSNLAGNALQHRTSGSTIRVRLDARAPECVVLQIWNQGVVPAELLPVLFEPLRTTMGGKRAGSSGLGLGLFISHEIATAHGGSIHAQSSEAEGTCFTLRLPRSPPPASDSNGPAGLGL